MTTAICYLVTPKSTFCIVTIFTALTALFTAKAHFTFTAAAVATKSPQQPATVRIVPTRYVRLLDA